MKNIYGFEKLYSQGLSISTPLNINYQNSSPKVFKEKELKIMIEEEDGEDRLQINTKTKIKKKISQYKLDPTLNWHVAEIISLNEGEN